MRLIGSTKIVEVGRLVFFVELKLRLRMFVFVFACSRPARGELLGGDVQAGPPVRVPLYRAGLLERPHQRGRARHHSRLHYDD